MVSRKEKRRIAILSLLSGVVANVPVRKCAIVKSVRRAKSDNHTLTPGELILLAFIKVPCAIDDVQRRLPRQPSDRTRSAWVTALQGTTERFHADCSTRNKNIHNMDPTYRRHRSCVATSRETTSGVVYMRDHMSHTLSDEDVEAIRAWVPASTPVHVDPLTNAIRKAPFRLGGTDYKRSHAIRTWATASRIFPSIRDESPDRPFFRMSNTLKATRAWLYPARHRGSPARARLWLLRYGRRLLRDLGVSDSRVMRRVRHMTRGDEACLVCEVGSVVPFMNQLHVDAMENIIRWGTGTAAWRCLVLEEESHVRGVLWSGRVAAAALVENFGCS